MLKKVEGPKKTASKNSEHDCPWSTSESHVASNWDPSCFTSYPGVSHNMAYPSGNQNQSLLTSPHYDNNCAEISGYFGQNTSLTSSVHPGGHTPPASLMQQRMVPAYNGIDRFMPRTTHLQERKRKREEGNKFSLIGTSEDNTEVVIGPQLPEIPKVDMDDESLNTSATLIRNKLKEVWVLEVLIVQTEVLVIHKNSDSQLYSAFTHYYQFICHLKLLLFDSFTISNVASNSTPDLLHYT